MTNDEKSFRAGNALELYDVGSEQENAIVDLLTDLHHYCNEEKFDLARCYAIAQWHFNAEIDRQKEEAHSLETCEMP